MGDFNAAAEMFDIGRESYFIKYPWTNRDSWPGGRRNLPSVMNGIGKISWDASV